jgi:hypothetical protein
MSRLAMGGEATSVLGVGIRSGPMGYESGSSDAEWRGAP